MWGEPDFIGTPRIRYGEDGPCYLRVCSRCGRFVKAPNMIVVQEDGPAPDVKVDCSRCGESTMPCEGYVP